MAMVLTSKQELFLVDPPKTGGTSIRFACGLGKLRSRDLRRFDVVGQPRHHSARDLCQRVGLNQWNKAITLGTVRNPYDRMVSAFHYDVDSKKAELDLLPTWSESCQIVATEETYRSFRQWLNKPKKRMKYAATCWSMLSDGTKLLVKHVLRCESLNSDWEAVCDIYGLPNKKLERWNASKRAVDWRKYYDEETANLITQSYQDDLDHFKYETYYCTASR
jgi:hypothetical protein